MKVGLLAYWLNIITFSFPLSRPRLLRYPFAHLNRVFSWSRLLVPPLSRAVLFPWWVPRSGMGSLLNFGFSLEPCHLRFFSQLNVKTALFSRAGVGSASE